ncbi:MAG TPA: HYR domain-containing protein, partial [Candidatus Nitrosopelagicus sp.]|nr:HYR domain-containing protein [Candidatus Nitrosopelagicus sp.]
SSIQSQNITVVDTTSPSIILPDDIIVEAIDEVTNIENIGDIISEDISGISSISNDAPEFFPLGETIVTWTVDDNYGNIVNASQTITVVDTTNPRILVSGDIIIEASSMGKNTIELDVPRVYDNVEIASISNDAPEFFSLGQTIVTWTATDTSENVSTAQQQISFQDTLQPSLSIPDNLLIEINDLSGMIVDIGVASAIDMVEINPQISNDAPELFPLGETVVRWTATDQSGNVIESEQIITIIDTTLPEFVIPLDISMEAQDKNTNYVEFDVPSVYDLVGISSISNDAPEFFPLGETIVTWTATDTSGNQSSISQLITIIDTTNPEIQISEKIILEATSKYENTVTLENLIANDTVEIASISNDAPEFFPLGETIVTWTATDTSGNSISEKQSVSIIDTISPTIQTIASLIIEADSQNNIVELGTISANDIVEIASISNDAPEFFPLGQTIVTWTATDTSGNSSSDVQVVKIVDTTAPIIIQPIDIENEATSIDQNIVNLGIADTIDSVSEIIISNDAPEFFPLGETIVTWTATDTSGNSSSNVQVVKIVDTTAPTIIQPIEIIADASSFTNTSIELSQPEVFDSVTDVKLKNNTNGSFAFGETIVTWTATDESGNSSSVTQKITIIDQSAPTLDIPTDIVIDANSPQSIIDIGNAIISDTVDVNPQISNDAPEFFPLGETIVTWTATDTSGNSFSSTQSINVQACGNSISYYNLILGTADDDILIGTNSSDLIFSFEGNDIISGNQGNDCILSGEGDDIIFGDQGNDNISGGSGSDIIKGQSGEDILQGGIGLDIINGGDDLDIYKTVDEINNDLILNCEINE